MRVEALHPPPHALLFPLQKNNTEKHTPSWVFPRQHRAVKSVRPTHQPANKQRFTSVTPHTPKNTQFFLVYPCPMTAPVLIISDCQYQNHNDLTKHERYPTKW